jgi:hypothetical protein
MEDKVIRDDIGQLKCVKLSLSDEDRERYRKIKYETNGKN